MERKIIKQNEMFFDRISNSYNKGIANWWSLTIQKNVLKFLTIKRNSKILDASLGTGCLLYLLSKTKKNLSLYGIDISKKMLKISREKLGNKAQLKLMAIEDLNFKNKFDYIFSVDAFHHYENKNLALKKMFGALKKGGTLIIVDIDFGFIFNKIFHKIEPGNTGMIRHKNMKELFKIGKFKKINQKKVWHCTYMTMGVK